MLNLLTEPIIRYEQPDGECVKASLPQIYAALMKGQAQSFPSLRHHQFHAWHAFLVQLGIMALRLAGHTTPPKDPGIWQNAIRSLTPGWNKNEPWHLVNDDITEPAFMQPPVDSPARQADYKTTITTPDELDILITSKNHHPKQRVATQAAPDDWIFALITLQTMQGYSGAGNYGIARMNGGLANRPCFSLAPANPSPGDHVRRDITVLLNRYDEFESQFGNPSGSINLLWTLPWDGYKSEALNPARLAPLFIEVCRRVRLATAGPNQKLYGLRASSKSARIDGTTLKGRTGDPWTPFDRTRDGLPLTLGPGGFTYHRVTQYLTSENWRRPFLLQPSETETQTGQNMLLVARGIVRGQGKTEGYYERIIPIGSKTAEALGNNETAELGAIAQQRIENAATVQRIFSHALHTFLAQAETANGVPEHRKIANHWAAKLDRLIDATFFRQLQEEYEAPEAQRPAGRRAWLQDDVIRPARALLRQATEHLPCTAARRQEAYVSAELLFEGRLRSQAEGIPQAFETTPQEPTNMTAKRPDTQNWQNDWGNLAAQYCYRVIQPDVGPGGLAQLRRMEPGKPEPAIFWQLLAEKNLLGYSPDTDAKWAAILHGIALTTKRNAATGRDEPAHDGNIPPGKALYLSGLSQDGLNRLITASEGTLRTLLSRTLRRAKGKGITLNWHLLAQFILSDGYDAEAASRHRRNIARDYHRAKHIGQTNKD